MPQVVVQVDDETLTALQAGQYFLRVSKAVATNAGYALPTLCFQVPPQALASNIGVAWDDDLGVSGTWTPSNPPPPNFIIRLQTWVSIGPGQTATVAPTGNISVGGPGVSGAITIEGSPQFAAGVTQAVAGLAQPIVGLSLPQDGSLVTVTPLDKVLLWFDTSDMWIGQMYTTAPQIGMFIDLAGGHAPSCSYDILSGWSSTSAQSVGQGEDVTSLLIIPAFGQ